VPVPCTPPFQSPSPPVTETKEVSHRVPQCTERQDISRAKLT